MNHVFRLLRFVKPYWKGAVISLILLSALVFLDLSIPRLIQRIIDQGINQHNQSVVLSTAALMIGISVLSAAIAIGNNIASVRVGEGLARDLRETIFLKIQSFSYANLDQQSTGRLLVRLTSDVNAFKNLVQISLRIGTRAPFMMIGSLILMVSTSSSLALTLLPLLVITSALIVFSIVKMEPLFGAVQKKLDRLNTVLQENIAGVRLVKAFVRADFEDIRFEGANEDLARNSIRVMKFMATLSPVLTLCVNIGVVWVLYSGGLQAARGDLSVGQIVAFTNYLLTTMSPLIMMTMLSNTWAAGIASANRIDGVLDTIPVIQDAPDAQALPADTQGRITLDSVTFGYNGESVLERVNLAIEPGQMVAILGATGAGKSTLVNLIPRFYDVKGGKIEFDGIDIRRLTQDSLLEHIGSVPQESILFSGTVRDNIRYARPEAGDEKVMAAARAAQAHDFIMQLPQAYETRVEERGVNLSGGQKQRIAIARALLMKPRVLILDDSTSSVDVETETRIQDALDLLRRGDGSSAPRMTCLVVAQRISTVLKADKIVVVDKGVVVAHGTHEQLLKSSPIYKEIYDSQLGQGNRAATLQAGAPGGAIA